MRAGAAAMPRAAPGPAARPRARPPRHADDAPRYCPFDRPGGGRARALRLYRELLPDRQRVQGPDHPDTLTTRHDIACLTGEAGDARERCGCTASCSGAAAHPRTWSPRHAEDARPHRPLDRRCGGCARGAAAMPRAAPGPAARPRARPPRHPGDAPQHRPLDRPGGGRAQALRLYRELLPDRQRVQGPDHPDTLTTRHDIACLTGEAGDARERCGYAASCSRTGSASSDLITPTR